EGDLLDLAVNGNLVEKSGSWFSYKGERIGQGRENAKQFLKENKDIAAKIEADVRKSLGLISVEDKAQAAAANAEATPHATPKPPAGRKYRIASKRALFPRALRASSPILFLRLPLDASQNKIIRQRLPPPEVP